MANKPIKSIKYPRLSDTYTFTQVDSTLTQSGQAADAKMVGDEISDLKVDLNQAIEDFAVPTQEAVDNWLDDHPEATTTVQDGAVTTAKLAGGSVTETKLASDSVSSDKVQDGAITTPKLSTDLKNAIVPLSKFSGSTDEEKLYTALITDGFKGTILGGNIVINSSISIPDAALREVKISNAIITLNADMFIAQSDNFARLPSFVNCKFIGNGNSVFGSNYGVFGDFIGCSFYECSIINNVNGTAQSAYFAYCEVLNNTVSLIKANNVYDCRIDGMVCESQNATLIDTYDSTGARGGPRTLWITNSMFEGFKSTVFKLAGGGPIVQIKDCYFEANADGCLKLKKSSDGYDYMTLAISGCKVNSSVTAFEISGFTNNYRVKISVHDNTYYTSVTGTPMVSGIPIENEFVVYNNRPSYATDIISDAARYIYEPETVMYPTDTPSLSQVRAGGCVQFGRLVFIDMNVKALATQLGTVSNFLTDLPKPAVNSVRIPIVSGKDGTQLSKDLYITTGGVATLYGGITADEIYRIKGFYFTSNKTVR